MRALVTGGRGFVGRHLVDKLLDIGWDVTDVDPIVEGTGGVTPTFVEASRSNYDWFDADCRQWFEEHNGEYFDVAFHLAAIVGGRLVIENDPLAVAEDLGIDAAFWRWMRSSQTERAVCFSSSAAYPISLQRSEGWRLLSEDDVNLGADSFGVPDMSYGWAKLTHEYLARLAWEKHQIPSVIYRPFSGYGEDQDLTYPFPAICDRAVRQNGTQKVWGPGVQKRDFVHIDDVVNAIIQTWDAFEDAQPINISTGRPTSFLELAHLAAAAVGYPDAEISNDPTQPVGVFARVGATALQTQLGVKHVVPLTEGVERGVQYARERMEHDG